MGLDDSMADARLIDLDASEPVADAMGVIPSARAGSFTRGYAAVRGHLNVMRVLSEHHADVNVADSGGNSPLLHAAMRGRTTAVRLLLESGANVNAASKHGWTPS